MLHKYLGLRNGDKIVIQEENGRYFFDNASLLSFARVEEEMQKYMLEIRKEVRGYKMRVISLRDNNG